MAVAIVLAAGGSTRMGAPKALVPVGGLAAVAHVTEAARAGGCAAVVVVLGAEADRILPAVPGYATTVVHRGWTRGRTSSLKAGLAGVPPGADVLVWPVDHPLATGPTARALLDAQGVIRVPTYRGRRGHPTLFAGALRDELLALGDDQPLNEVVRARPGRVVEVPVPDEGVVLNLDTPGSVRRATDRPGR